MIKNRRFRKFLAVFLSILMLTNFYGSSFSYKAIAKDVKDVLSPIVYKDGTVVFNYLGEAGTRSVTVPGSFNEWDTSKDSMTNVDGVWTLSKKLVPGVYEYKFYVDGQWIHDPLNPHIQNDNSVVIVPGVQIEAPTAVEIGDEVYLSAKFVNETGEKKDIEATWSLDGDSEGVELEGNKLTITGSAKGNTTFILKASFGEYVTEHQIRILSTMYEYTINYYRNDGKQMEWDMWIWEDGKSGNAYPFTTKAGEFAQAKLKFESRKINVITRPGNWSTQEVERVVQVPEGQTSVEVWIVQDIKDVFYNREDVVIPDDTEVIPRYVQFTYVRPDHQYQDWDLWVWSTGSMDGAVSFDQITDKGAVAKFEIGKNATNVGFIIRKGGDAWSAKDVEQDRFIPIDATETLTKVIAHSGVPEIYVLPTIKGPVLEEGRMTFYYRDPQLYEQNAMHTIDKVELKFGGKTYEMVYVEQDELFRLVLEDIPEGVHEYSYLVTKDGTTYEVTDPYNTKEGKSVVELRKGHFELAAKVNPSKIDYNQNAVVSLEVTTKDDIGIREIYIDATPIGGPEKLVVDPSLLKQTLAVKDSVPAGVKELTVTLVDEFGNKHSETFSLEVLPRVSQGKLDFDWDEARIYFLLTDRFFDGDPTNNPLPEEGYDPNHPEAFHGGDFQGIIDKLDYLEDLGINTIWITPIVDNIDFNQGSGLKTVEGLAAKQYAYHGYWAEDFTKLEARLGDIETFKTLIDEAHNRGIKIMVDVVLNHAGYGTKNSEMFKGMLREDPEPGNPQKEELSGLPDFKTEDPVVREKLIEWQTAWLEILRTDRGDTIDYFRVDTVKHVEDTTWKAFKNALTEIKPNFKLIGEYWGAGFEDYGQLRSGQMDSLLDFNFKDIAKDFVSGNIEKAEDLLVKRNEKIDNTATLGQFLSSHDEDGFLYTLGGDIGKFMVAASLQITAKGQPVIYYGEEIGQSGKSGWDVRDGVHYSFGENRSSFDWSKLENGDKTALLLHGHYKKLLHIRDTYSKVFSKGTRTWVAGGDQEQYSIHKRDFEGQTLYVGLNISSDEKTASFHVDEKAGTVLKDLYNGGTYVVSDEGIVSVTIPKNLDGGTIILVANDEGKDDPGKDESGKDEGAKDPGKTEDQSGQKPHDGDKGNDDSKGNLDGKEGKDDQGKKLPSTATNLYQVAIFGMILLAISMLLFYRRRKETSC